MYPILFYLGSLKIYAYGFFIAIGFVLGLILAIRSVRKEGILSERMADLFFIIVLSSLLGSRIFYVLINFDVYRENPLRIIQIWEGGLVFYGGFIFAVVTSLIYMRLSQLPLWRIADLSSPPVALGLFWGRIGCFFAGCCYGKETSLPWGMTFTDPNSLARLHVALHPTQLYEALTNLAIFFFLYRKRKRFEGQLFWLFILLYAISRFLIEFLRGDPRGTLFGGLFSTSQGIGIFLAFLSLFMLFYLERKKRK